jgi:hypothetical protein
MTEVRQDFLAHLQLRGYAAATVKNYIQSVSLLARTTIKTLCFFLRKTLLITCYIYET